MTGAVLAFFNYKPERMKLKVKSFTCFRAAPPSLLTTVNSSVSILITSEPCSFKNCFKMSFSIQYFSAFLSDSSSELIVSNILEAYKEGRNCLVLSERLEHLDILHDLLTKNIVILATVNILEKVLTYQILTHYFWFFHFHGKEC